MTVGCEASWFWVKLAHNIVNCLTGRRPMSGTHGTSSLIGFEPRPDGQWSSNRFGELFPSVAPLLSNRKNLEDLGSSDGPFVELDDDEADAFRRLIRFTDSSSITTSRWMPPRVWKGMRIRGTSRTVGDRRCGWIRCTGADRRSLGFCTTTIRRAMWGRI